MSNRNYRIIYMSRNLLPGSPDEIAAQVETILAVSRRNNGPAGVGGVLMFNNGCFLQVLEGPFAEVSRTFERIQRDDRHSEVIVLDAGYAEERRFPDWSMAFVGADAADARRYSAMQLDREKFDAVAKDEILGQLETLVGADELRVAA